MNIHIANEVAGPEDGCVEFTMEDIYANDWEEHEVRYETRKTGFMRAVYAMKKGYAVRLPGWGDKVALVDDCGSISLRRDRGGEYEFERYQPSIEEATLHDWEVVKPQQEGQ